MNVHFLEKNPFFLLEVAPTDKRATIISKAEEKSFFLEGNACDEAQTSLLNPSKRLSAEMDWFCECDETTVSNIRLCIRNKTAIRTDELTGLAKLNAALFNFAISAYDDYFDIGYAILDIDEQYSVIDASILLETLNACHTKAGILPVSEDEVDRELNKKREQIRKFISDKIQSLSEDDYIEFITMLAEKCIADEDYSDGVIIADVVDQYELKMQSLIEDAANEISSRIERIKRAANKEGIEADITDLIRLLKKWDKLVQPLQLKSMASGAAHQVSEHIGYKIRGLSLWLNNEQELTQAALSLVNASKDVFAEIGGLSDVFGEDADALNRILNEQKELNEIFSEIKDIEWIIAIWKDPNKNTTPYLNASDAITEHIVDLISKIKALNSKIKAINTTDETICQLRKRLCFLARDGVIYAHNERHQTDLALSVARVLLDEFGDMEELRGKLSEDVSALDRQLTLQNASDSAYQSSPAYQAPPSSGSKKGCLISVIAAIVLIVAIFSGIRSNNSTGSNNSNSSGNQPSYNQSTEKKFSSSVTAGTDVYADIVSIFPAIGIYTEGFTYYTDFVCECKTSSGSTVWVYMSASEYKKYFDSDASTSINTSTAEEITFSYSKRIHGAAEKADSIMYGLSSDTGTSLLINFDSVD